MTTTLPSWPGAVGVPSSSSELDQQVFHGQVQAFVPVALRPDEHDLPRAIGLEHRGREHLLDQLPLKAVQLLGADDQGPRLKRLQPPLLRARAKAYSGLV